jgi:hypothetical protein
MAANTIENDYRINGIRITQRASGNVFIGDGIEKAPCYPVWLPVVPLNTYLRRPAHAALGEAALEAVLLAATASPEKVAGWNCGRSL